MSSVLGVRELQGEIARMNRDLEQAEDPAAMAAAEPIKEAWKGLVPILDGNYRDALTVQWIEGIRKAAIGTGWLASLPPNEQPVMYAKRLEFGTGGVTARPSARPAMKAARPQALEAGAVPLRMVVRGRRPRKVVATT